MENKVSILYIGGSLDAINELAAHPEISLIHEGNALAATNYLKSAEKPDAVLCELTVAGGDGFQINDLLREDRIFDSMAFILICHEFKEDIFKKAFLYKRDTVGRIDDFFVLPLADISGLVSRIRFLISFREKEIELLPYHMPPIKRLFDILVASVALLCLSPLLLIVIIAIRLESKGKVYYTSRRRGRGLQEFNFYKLRSMRVGADAELGQLAKDKNQYASASKQTEIDFEKPCPRCSKLGGTAYCSDIVHIGEHSICEYMYLLQKNEINKSQPAFIKIVDDPRITKVGKFIRNTSIDELPQLINVIKGDMSIVGNRPLPVYEADLLTKGVYAKRSLAPAGLTGLWQVRLRGQGGVMSEEERKNLDNEYADHFSGNKYSFWYDLKLIFQTFRALFQKGSV